MLSNVTTTASPELFREVMTTALENDDVLSKLNPDLRNRIQALVEFIDEDTPLLHAYKALQSWPPAVPSGNQYLFQLALEETVKFLKRRLEPKLIPLLAS